jgi:hypothetical protein
VRSRGGQSGQRSRRSGWAMASSRGQLWTFWLPRIVRSRWPTCSSAWKNALGGWSPRTRSVAACRAVRGVRIRDSSARIPAAIGSRARSEPGRGSGSRSRNLASRPLPSGSDDAAHSAEREALIRVSVLSLCVVSMSGGLVAPLGARILRAARDGTFAQDAPGWRGLETCYAQGWQDPAARAATRRPLVQGEAASGRGAVAVRRPPERGRPRRTSPCR